MEGIGKEDVRSLEIIPAKFIVYKDWYMTYACKSCTSKETDNAFCIERIILRCLVAKVM